MDLDTDRVENLGVIFANSDYDPYFITAILFGWFIISASSFRYFIRVLNYEATDSKTILMNSERR